MVRTAKSRLFVMGLALASLGLASCGADPSSMDGGSGDGGSGTSDRVSNKVHGSVSEWKVEVSADKAEAGEVIFAIANFGSIDHEFLVTKTTYEPGKIPLGPEDKFDESLEGIEVIDEIPEYGVNETKILKLSLEPGQYELLCNIVGHYKAGMHTFFEVLPGDNAGEGSESGDGEGDAGAGDEVSNDITGSVNEWAVGVSATAAKAGEVTFNIENQGTIAHEFLVARTDIEPGQIPLTEENKFDEELDGLTVVDEIKEWEPGQTQTLKVNLEPGKYQLLCNIVGHYKAGMWVGFEVVS